MIRLTEEQLENILKAAKRGQAHRLEVIQLIEKLLNEANRVIDDEDDDTPDINQFRHLQAEHGRTSRIIQEIERKVIFTLDRD